MFSFFFTIVFTLILSVSNFTNLGNNCQTQLRERVGDPCCPFHQNFQINLNHILVDSFCAERSQILVQCHQMMLPQKYWKWSAQNLLCFGAKYVFGEIGHNSETDELMNRECCAISFGSFCTLWWWFGFKREPTLPRMDQP